MGCNFSMVLGFPKTVNKVPFNQLNNLETHLEPFNLSLRHTFSNRKS